MLPSTFRFGIIASAGLAIAIAGPRLAVATMAQDESVRDRALGLLLGGFLVMGFALAAIMVRGFCRLATKAGLLGALGQEPVRRRILRMGSRWGSGWCGLSARSWRCRSPGRRCGPISISTRCDSATWREPLGSA